MASNNHVIAQCQWQTQFDDQSHAVALQDAISQWSNQLLPTLIGECFDKYCPSTQIWRIEQLNLDLGVLNLSELDQQLPQRIANALEEALATLFSQQKVSFYSAKQPKLRIIDKNGSEIDLVRWYLLHGNVPWWDAGHISPLATVDQQLQEQPNAVASLLRDIGTKEAVRRRIVWQWGEVRTRQTVQVLEPWNANFILSYASNLLSAQQHQDAQDSARQTRASRGEGSVKLPSDSNFKPQLWYWILTHLLVERGSIFNTQQFVRSTLWQMAQHYQWEFTDLLQQLSQVAESMQTAGLVAPQFLQVLVTLQQEETQQNTAMLPMASQPDFWMMLQNLLHTRQAENTIASLLPDSPDSDLIASNQQRIHISELFVRLAHQDRVRTAKILKQEGASDTVREFLIAQLNDEQLALIVEVVAPREQRFIMTHVAHTQSFLKAQRVQPTLIWQVLLAYLLVNTGSYFNRRQFIQVTLNDISRKQRIDYQLLLALLIQAPVQKHISGQHFELLAILQELQKQQDPQALQHYANWQQLSHFLLHGEQQVAEGAELSGQPPQNAKLAWQQALQALIRIQPAHSPHSLLNLLKQHVLAKSHSLQLAKRLLTAISPAGYASGTGNLSELRQLFHTLSPQHGPRSLQVMQRLIDWEQQGRLPQLHSHQIHQQLGLAIVQSLIESIAPTRSASQWLALLYQCLATQLGVSAALLAAQIQHNAQQDLTHGQLNTQLARLLQSDAVNPRLLLNSYVHIYELVSEQERRENPEPSHPSDTSELHSASRSRNVSHSPHLSRSKNLSRSQNQRHSSELSDEQCHIENQIASSESSLASTAQNLPADPRLASIDTQIGEQHLMKEIAAKPETTEPHSEALPIPAEVQAMRSSSSLDKDSSNNSSNNSSNYAGNNAGNNSGVEQTSTRFAKYLLQATLNKAQALANQPESARLQQVAALIAELIQRRMLTWHLNTLANAGRSAEVILDALFVELSTQQQWHYLQLLYAGLFGRVFASAQGQTTKPAVQSRSIIAMQRDTLIPLRQQLARMFTFAEFRSSTVTKPSAKQRKSPVLMQVWQQLLQQNNAAQIIQGLANSAQGQQWLAAFLPKQWQTRRQQQQLIQRLQQLVVQGLSLLPAHANVMQLHSNALSASSVAESLQRIFWQRLTYYWQQQGRSAASLSLLDTEKGRGQWLAHCVAEWAKQQQISQYHLAKGIQQSLRQPDNRQWWGESAVYLAEYFDSFTKNSDAIAIAIPNDTTRVSAVSESVSALKQLPSVRLQTSNSLNTPEDSKTAITDSEAARVDQNFADIIQDPAANYLSNTQFSQLFSEWLSKGVLPAHLTQQANSAFSVRQMLADVLQHKPQLLIRHAAPLLAQQSHLAEQALTRLLQNSHYTQVLDTLTRLGLIPSAEANVLHSMQTLLAKLAITGVNLREKQQWLQRILLHAWLTQGWQNLNADALLQQLCWLLLNSNACSSQQLIIALQQPNLPGNQQVLQAVERVIEQLKTAQSTASQPSAKVTNAQTERQTALDALNTDPSSVEQKLRQAISAEMADNLAQDVEQPVEFPIAINNAGLALIQSFMRPLFERLQLTENDKFLTPAKQRAAVHYLQFLATGQTHTEEHHLLFNKLLCGLAPSQPIEAGVDLTQQEIDTIHSLVDAVTNYWNAIGKTSIDGFRGNWIVRNGTLTEAQDHWDLIVEKRAYDILINRSPLSYSIIKLPWMNKPIYVTWPT